MMLYDSLLGPYDDTVVEVLRYKLPSRGLESHSYPES